MPCENQGWHTHTQKKKSYYRTKLVNACRDWNMYLTGKLENGTCMSFRHWPCSLFQLPKSIYFLREFIQNILHRLIKQNPTTWLFFIILRKNITITNFTNKKNDELSENKTMCTFQVTLIIIRTIKEKLWIQFNANLNKLSHKWIILQHSAVYATV